MRVSGQMLQVMRERTRPSRCRFKKTEKPQWVKDLDSTWTIQIISHPMRSCLSPDGARIGAGRYQADRRSADAI
jgi:hypothetical protein